MIEGDAHLRYVLVKKAKPPKECPRCGSQDLKKVQNAVMNEDGMFTINLRASGEAFQSTFR